MFKTENFIPGFKDSFLTKNISLWKLNGSIFSSLIWRTLRQLRIIDSTLEPEGEKGAFSELFDKTKSFLEIFAS